MTDAEETVELPTEAAKRMLNELLVQRFNSEDFTLEIKPGSKTGDNYLGIVFRVKAIANATKEKLSIIVKLSPTNEARRDQFFARSSFLNEAKFYDQIFPILTKFQQRHGINNKKHGFFEVPHCLRTNTVEMEEAIFMEDLKEEGFEMFDRHSECSLQHCKLTLEILGKFHAISLAMKEIDPEQFKLFSSFKEMFLERKEDTSLQEWFNNMKDKALLTLDQQNEKDLIERVKAVLDPSIMQTIQQCTDGETAEPYAVLNHGDCWNNNILFKNKDGVPTEARILDWQILRYASPACDLIYFIFTITSKEFRDTHYDQLLRIYHESLSEFLIAFGLEPEKVFPFTALEDQLQKFGKYGLIMTVMLLPIMTAVSEDIPNIEEISERIKNGEDKAYTFTAANSEGKYKEKMSNVIRDMCQLGYI